MCLTMNDTEFEQILRRKYAQIVLNELLNAEENGYTFSALRKEVNAIAADDSRGAKEASHEEDYSPASLSSLLSVAEDAGIAEHYLHDGKKRWRICLGQLSSSQINRIRSRNSTTKTHMDSSRRDYYGSNHTDSSLS